MMADLMQLSSENLSKQINQQMRYKLFMNLLTAVAFDDDDDDDDYYYYSFFYEFN